MTNNAGYQTHGSCHINNKIKYLDCQRNKNPENNHWLFANLITLFKKIHVSDGYHGIRPAYCSQISRFFLSENAMRKTLSLVNIHFVVIEQFIHIFTSPKQFSSSKKSANSLLLCLFGVKSLRPDSVRLNFDWQMNQSSLRGF